MGRRVGGVNVFGGGLVLYNASTIIGGIGVSGDTSCSDHIVAWKLRHAVALDHVPNGLTAPVGGDNIIHEIVPPSFNQGQPADTPSDVVYRRMMRDLKARLTPAPPVQQAA